MGGGEEEEDRNHQRSDDGTMEKGKESRRKWWWFSHSCPTITRRRRRHGLSPFLFRAAAAISFPVDFSSSYSIIWNTPNTHKRNVGLFTSIVLYYVRSVFHSWIQSFEIIENKDPTVRLRKRHSLFFFFFFFFLLSSFPTVFYVSCDINSVLKWKKKKPSDPWCLGRFFHRPPISFSPWQKVAQQLIGRGRLVKVNTGPVFN